MRHSLLAFVLVATAALNYLYATFGAQGHTAYAVMMAESSGNEYAASPTGDYGLMQINLSAHWSELPGVTATEKINRLFNPYNNIDEAKNIYNGCGCFSAWSAWQNGRYAQYL